MGPSTSYGLLKGSLSLFAVSLLIVVPLSARAVPDVCQSVKGTLTEFPTEPFLSPGDPFGRLVGTAKGTLDSIGTSILTSVGPGPDPGTLGGTTRHAFILNDVDQLLATGAVVWTPIAGTANVTAVLTLTVQGGTGKFSGATGQIVGTGIGFNFFPLPPGPSTANQSSFVFKLSGNYCLAP